MRTLITTSNTSGLPERYKVLNRNHQDNINNMLEEFMGIKGRLLDEIRKHCCGEVGNMFGGYDCEYCEEPYLKDGCMQVRTLRYILEGS